MKKKVASLAISLALAVGLCPGAALAGTGEDAGLLAAAEPQQLEMQSQRDGSIDLGYGYTFLFDGRTTVYRDYYIGEGQSVTPDISIYYYSYDETVDENGRAILPANKYTLSYAKLNEDYDYVPTSLPLGIGRYKVTATAAPGSGLTGELDVTFDILSSSLQVPITRATVSDIENQTYTGQAIEPEPTLLNGPYALSKNEDYTLSYENNVNVGTATVTITAVNMGLYTGSITRTFTIDKASNWFYASSANYDLKVKRGKKKAFKASKLYKISDAPADGTLTYKLKSASKKAKKYIKVASNGNVTVKKGVRKGSYSFSVAVTSTSPNYKTETQDVTFWLTVK